ncbi:TPA_asm: hypothetical protein vir519_00001 [Caudoviricetes sp. vir519]|nr:TPA_asm: hypothetical protein vir519_00001 [Caudoviricetes sp. vir519]
MNLNLTQIETADFSWNAGTGCTYGCSFCYARQKADGWLRQTYLNGDWEGDPSWCSVDPFYPRFWPKRLKLSFPKNKISKNPYLERGQYMTFVCDMGDLFDLSMRREWIDKIFSVMCCHPHQVFQLLTKQADIMSDYQATEWSSGFPKNIWAGVTVTSQYSIENISCLTDMKTSIRYVCFEPILSEIEVDLQGIDWIILGAQTKPFKKPHDEWVIDLVENALCHGIPVFLKDSLSYLLNDQDNLREFPPWRC